MHRRMPVRAHAPTWPPATPPAAHTPDRIDAPKNAADVPNVVDAAMELDPAGLLPALPASYWRDHPEALTGSGLIAASAGGVLVERGGRRLLIGVGLGSNILPASLGTSRGGALLSTLRALRVPPASVDTVAFTHLHTDHTASGSSKTATKCCARRPRGAGAGGTVAVAVTA
ncbi:MBL fold metallo-hydrolase [Streptomyces virginiae]|uniref:MBL fold metallo-hydrolase n=1 Tax=Streptomyces virginiae TaxID=1961 RepID=UPI003253AC49